jgi:hypothetical protein
LTTRYQVCCDECGDPAQGAVLSYEAKTWGQRSEAGPAIIAVLPPKWIYWQLARTVRCPACHQMQDAERRLR